MLFILFLLFIGHAISIATDIQAGLTNTTRPGVKVSKKYRAIGLYREAGKGVTVASYTCLLMTDGSVLLLAAATFEPCPRRVVKRMW
ncbi:hypothetical protein C1X65_18690 [Pseudomonas sp. FW305-70]|nr:hypothetical protein C1X65_18690 [Pseudomonas sp. FW305-70]